MATKKEEINALKARYEELKNKKYSVITISNCNVWGNCDICLENSNNTIEGNEILNNIIGIFSNASNSTINNNYVCGITNRILIQQIGFQVMEIIIPVIKQIVGMTATPPQIQQEGTRTNILNAKNPKIFLMLLKYLNI